MDVFRAGTAKVRITPSEAHMQASAAFIVERDIYTRALVMESGEKIAIISVETERIPWVDQIIAAVSEGCGYAKRNILICPTLNKQASLVDYSREDSFSALRDAILEAVPTATAAMEPCKIAFAHTTSNINAYFGKETFAGYVEMPNFSEFADKTLNLLRVESLTRKTVAILANYAMHSDLMYAASKSVSGDVAGCVSDYVEKRLQCVCLYTVSPCKHLHPLTLSN